VSKRRCDGVIPTLRRVKVVNVSGCAPNLVFLGKVPTNPASPPDVGWHMAAMLKNTWGLFKTAGANWLEDKAPRLGAAVSYYTIFAIPPLFVIVLFLVSLVVDQSKVQTLLFSEIGGLIGDKSSEALQGAMAAQSQHNKGLIASVIAIGTLVVTATGLFIELQDALNTIWGVKEKPGQGIMGFVKNRLLSFTMVIGIGFLLLVSLVVSTALSALNKYVSALVPGLDVLWTITNVVVSFAVITLLFAMIFKVLPDVKIRWRDVWVGAVTTAALFTIGKFALGMYIGKSSAVSAYGAAGSLVLVLLWVYYSAQILFFGAEVTEVYANRYGSHLEPASNAQWIHSEAQQKSKPAPSGKPRRSRRAELDGVPTADRRQRLMSDLRNEVESLRDLVER